MVSIWIIYGYMVGGWYTYPKIRVKVNWDDEIPNESGKISRSCSRKTTNQMIQMAIDLEIDRYPDLWRTYRIYSDFLDKISENYGACPAICSFSWHLSMAAARAWNSKGVDTVGWWIWNLLSALCWWLWSKYTYWHTVKNMGVSFWIGGHSGSISIVTNVYHRNLQQ